MNQLSNEKCEPLGTTAEKLNHTEIVDLLQQLPSWNLGRKQDHEYLEKTFEFKNFKDALEFAVKIGDLAEAVNHHPLMLIEWGYTTICWWTHSLHGLHRNDFIMAAKTNALYE